MKKILVLLLLLTGCASTHMKQYLGHNIIDVVIDRGPPVNVVQIDETHRGYQFKWGGALSPKNCIITYITTLNDGTWIVSDLNYPRGLIC